MQFSLMIVPFFKKKSPIHPVYEFPIGKKNPPRKKASREIGETFLYELIFGEVMVK